MTQTLRLANGGGIESLARRRAAFLLLAAALLGLGLATIGAWRGDLWLVTGGFAETLLCLAALASVLRRDPELAPRTVEPAEERRDLLAASPDPVIEVDARLVVTGANDAARAIIPGLRPHHPLSFALRAPEVLDAARASFASGQAATVELRGRTQADPTYEVRLRPLPVGSRASQSLALFFRDLTAERRLEAMRVDFVATVSHELRTPLASLAGFIDTLRGPARNDPAARDRFLAIMREQANRMARLVDDLLQLSRVELHEHVAPATPVDLAHIVGHMVEILNPLARERGVAISVAIREGPHLVLGDRDELLRVVENLVENGVKYGGSGKKVEVTLEGPGQGRWVELAVQDHGPGVAPEHLPRLTERFYRVDPVESRSQGGTGLGLAIVKHVVGRHRGRLSIDSELGSGTRVLVQLPAHARP